jgi:hypothetical protein
MNGKEAEEWITKAVVEVAPRMFEPLRALNGNPGLTAAAAGTMMGLVADMLVDSLGEAALDDFLTGTVATFNVMQSGKRRMQKLSWSAEER